MGHAYIVQEFTGYVTAVHEHDFDVVLIDLTDTGRPDEVAKISFDVIPKCEHELITIGARFVWIIYEATPPGGSPLAGDIFKFYQSIWTQVECDAIRESAARMAEILNEAGDGGKE